MPRRVPIERWTVAGARAEDDWLAEEAPLTIQVAHWFKDQRRTSRWGVTLRTPGADAELAAGLLFAEGHLDNASAVERIESVSPGEITVSLRPGAEFDLTRPRLATAACGFCGSDGLPAAQPLPDHGFRVRIGTLQSLPGSLRGTQRDYGETGALHAAALFHEDGVIQLLREDIGRHNAVDKLIGHCLLQESMDLSRCGLLLSGRAGFELVQKAARAGIPFVASIGAPTTMSVELARSVNITLAGFVKQDRANVYTGTWRVTKV